MAAIPTHEKLEAVKNKMQELFPDYDIICFLIPKQNTGYAGQIITIKNTHELKTKLSIVLGNCLAGRTHDAPTEN